MYRQCVRVSVCVRELDRDGVVRRPRRTVWLARGILWSIDIVAAVVADRTQELGIPMGPRVKLMGFLGGLS